MLVAGGEAIADIDTLRHQEEVLGPVASPPTVWRALDELSPACLKRVAAARAKTRARVWDLLPGGLPAARVADTTLPAGLVVLDVDATIVVAHSEKEHAAPTFKKTFGYHPIGVWCDNTGELLAARLRPGNAGSNTAADHTAVLTEAIAQIPARHRRNLLIRVDGAGFSHERGCQVVCVSEVGHMGLEVGVDAVGVDEGELAQGGFPALDDGAFDELAGGLSGAALG